MSLLGRFFRRLTGNLTDARPPRAWGGINVDAELPFLHEQIRAYNSGVPIRAMRLDNFSCETVEMREGYRRALLAEPAIKAALVGKIAAVQALGLQVKPYEDTPFDQNVAAFVKQSLETCRGGVPALVDSILTPGLTDGFSVGEKVWKREHRGRWKDKIGLMQLKSKDSRYIQFELDPYRNITGVISLRGNSGTQFPPSDFVIFSHMSLFESPFGTSDLRAAYRAAEMIPAILNLRMIFLDKYAGPFLLAKVNDPALVAEMKEAMSQARSGGFWVGSPQDEVEAIELSMKGTGEFLDALKDLREEIATGISGAFLHMMNGDGGSGQRGNSAVQQDTVDLFIWLLAVKVAACINEQLVPDLVDLNFGSGCGLPVVSLEAPNPEHIVAELQIDEMLHAMNVPLSVSELYERSGRRPPKDPADTLKAEPITNDQAANALPGLPTLPGARARTISPPIPGPADSGTF